MKFCIIANMEIKKNKTYIKYLKEWISNNEKDNTISIAKVEQDKFGNYIYTNIPNDTDFIIALGGDGTILQASQNSIKLNIPIIGFNTGTLGFLSEYKIKNIKSILLKVLNNEYLIEERMMLEVYDSKNNLLDICLNDIVIAREGFSRIVSIETKVDDKIINQFRGDGIIVSTPTGSTGYNLSLGGPIVSPKAKNIIITPIACHSLLSRPIVLSDEENIDITIMHSRKTQEKEAILTCDGRRNIDLHSGDVLTVKTSNKKVKLLKITKNNFFEICNEKLKEC